MHVLVQVNLPAHVHVEARGSYLLSASVVLCGGFVLLCFFEIGFLTGPGVPHVALEIHLCLSLQC